MKYKNNKKVLPWIIYKRKQINWIDIAFKEKEKRNRKCVRKNILKKSDYFFFVKKNFTIVIYEKAERKFVEDFLSFFLLEKIKSRKKFR